MTDVLYSDGTSVNYGYNEIGTVTTMEDSIGTTTYQYDDMQRLISTTDSNDKTVSYTYDILGRRTSIVLPDGQTTNYEYDVLDRLTTVYDGTELLAEYEYNANSQLISNSRNDITTVYEYNELGQITQLTTSDISEQIQQFSYQYDKIGNITEEVRTERDTTNTRTYSYDNANQLVEFSDNDYVEKYAYDSVGNMLSKDVNGALTSYEFNEANQLVTETIEQKTIEYIYNQNGDLVEKSSGEQYTYDIQGNLTSIIGNGINQSFTYNGNGNRLSKTVDGEITYFVNDLNQRYEQVVQTYNDDGVIDTYTYGLLRIDSKGQTTETYLYDGRGSVVGSVNADNDFVSYSYTAYGELMPSSPTPTVFGYNAEATDFDTGMQYLRARYYDTSLGRFFQEDDYKGSYLNPISMNRYGYTHSNPIMGIDPSGHATGFLVSMLKSALEGDWWAVLAHAIGGLTENIIYMALMTLTNGVLPGIAILLSGFFGGIAAGLGSLVSQIMTSVFKGEKININTDQLILAGVAGFASGLILGGIFKTVEIQGTPFALWEKELIGFLQMDFWLGLATNIATEIDKFIAKRKGENMPIEDDANDYETNVIEPESEKPVIIENVGPCEPNYRYVYDDELDRLYDEKHKAEMTGSSAYESAVNQQIDRIEGEKVRHIDEQIDILNDQINKVNGVGCSSAIEAMEKEKRKLEADKDAVMYNVTKPENSHSSSQRQQVSTSTIKKPLQTSHYGIGGHQMAY